MINIDRKSGFVTYFQHGGKSYTVIAGCECAAEAYTLMIVPSGYDKLDELTVNLCCSTHGPRLTIARVERDRQRTARELAIFGPAEERFHNDKRIQWGKVARGGIS